MPLRKPPFYAPGARVGAWRLTGGPATRRGAQGWHWPAVCDCGTLAEVREWNLRRGKSLSCGCQMPARVRAQISTHGKSRTKVYRSWTHLIGRCCNPSDAAYANYGGRGITVSREWRKDFAAFYAHVGEPPSPRHAIDRIDNSRGYEPGNVRWVTPAENNLNRRNVIQVTAFGETKPLVQWCAETGVKYATALWRLTKAKWDPHFAIGLI